MSDNIGWYYLHQNGSLIFKRDMPGIVFDFEESDLVVEYWRIDTTDRSTCWDFLLEALAKGASVSRIAQICTLWNCDLQDFIYHINDKYSKGLKPTEDQSKGFVIFAKEIAKVDINKFWEWLKDQPIGSFPDVNSAMEDLR